MGFLKKLPTSTIVLLLFAIFFAVFGCRQLSISNKSKSIPIVDIGNGVVSAENEGKNVCVTGKLEIEEMPTDDQTLFKANSVALIRKVEMYQYYLSNDTLYKDFRSEQELDIRDKQDEEYINPSFPDGVKNKVFFAKAKIGDLVISEEFLNEIVEANVKSVGETAEKTVERKYLENISLVDYVAGDDGYFINYADRDSDNEDSDEYAIGDIRVRFEYIDMDALGEVTMCGCQKNDKLVADSDLYNGVFYSTSADEIEKQFYENASSAVVFFFTSGLMTLVAILIYKKKSKKEARA